MGETTFVAGSVASRIVPRLRRASKRAGAGLNEWVNRILLRAGVPSAIPVADHASGTVVWFGVKYEVRSFEGDVPARTIPAIVYRTATHDEIGRIVPVGARLELAFTSNKPVDKRALQRVAEAWFV
jgi:hypothetical protein